jgi:hypothetical protein
MVPRKAFAPLLLGLTLGLSAWGILALHPYEISYYSEAIGGLRGAERAGFEVSYWFDALTPEARVEVQALLPRGARLQTAPRYTGYPLLRAWGLWREDLVDDEEEPEYLLLLSRKGYYTQIPSLARIEAQETPVWSLRARGVALLRLYRLPGSTPLR